MRLTILGKSPSWPDAGGACSGYLVEGGGVRLLIDCGPGVFAALRTVAGYDAVDAVLLSHGHADHVLDLVPYASALVYGPRAVPGRRVPLHLHEGAMARLEDVSAGGGMPAGHVGRAFAPVEHPERDTFAVGGLELALAPVPHPQPCWAVDVREPATGARLTYSGDCSPNPELVALARDTPLLVVEATVPEPLPDVHLTPREAGEHGRAAGARTVVLTHFSDEVDPGAWRREGAAGFGGEVTLARAGDVYDLP
jgi:ribonuclease BN (tRNA processing enzyme)